MLDPEECTDKEVFILRGKRRDVLHCRLCLLEESEENLRSRYTIIRKQREEAYRRLEEAKATVKYMEDKAAHYEAILAGLAPDDTNPKNWTAGDRPEHETCSFS